jgi:hypothetical protein
MTLFSNIRSSLTLAVVTAGAISLFAGAAAQASPVGSTFDVSLNNFGAAGGGNVTAATPTFGTPSNVDDLVVTTTSTILGNGNELLEISLTSASPFTSLTDGTANWDIFINGFQNTGNVVSHYWSLTANGAAVGMQNGAPGSAPYVEGLSPIDGVTEVLFNPNQIGGQPQYILGGFGFVPVASNLSLWLDDNANVPLVNGLHASFEVVPEPGTALLLGLGLAGLAGRRRQRASE